MVGQDYRDIYTVVDLLQTNAQPIAGTPVVFENGMCFNANKNRLGDISSYLADDVEYVKETIEQLRKDGLVPSTYPQTSFISKEVIELADYQYGVIQATLDNLAIVYVCSTDANELERMVDDYLDSQATFQLTEKGLKYLAELEEAAREADRAENVCLDERKENSTMDNLFNNMGFGKLRNARFKLSMNGIAVSQDSGKYVVYNKDNNEFVDVTNTLLDIKDALFLLPAVEVNPGDTVLHEDKAYYIVSTANNEIKAVSYEDCTQTVLIPKSTMFGVKYFTKVYSLFGDNFAADGDLFSNPMMLMALMNGGNSDLTQLMLLSSMSKGDFASNPMALAMLMKGDKSEDSLSTIALMSIFNKGANPFTAKKTKTNREDTDQNE